MLGGARKDRHTLQIERRPSVKCDVRQNINVPGLKRLPGVGRVTSEEEAAGQVEPDHEGLRKSRSMKV